MTQNQLQPTTHEPGATPMVQIVGLKKSFGHNEVLRDVSLTVKEGSVTCLIGPSGSGKTTLLRCVNQLETFNSGVIRVDGELVGATKVRGRLVASPKELARSRRQTGMVFQRFNLFPHRTVLEVMRELALEGMTMMVVTHELGFARDVSDHVVFMADGVVVEEGHPDAVLRNPGHQRTRDFLARVL